MKKLIFIFFCFNMVFAEGDSLTFPTTVTNFADGDTFGVPFQWKPLVDSLLSWGNGRIGNLNLNDTAGIEQTKIDSSSGWIINRLGVFNDTLSFKNLRSNYGFKLFLNDSTLYDKEFIIVSDSTDSIAIFSNDSLLLYKTAYFDSSLTVSDSLIVNGGIRSANNIVAGNDVIGDSIIAVSGIRSPHDINGQFLIAGVDGVYSNGPIIARNGISIQSGSFDILDTNSNSTTTIKSVGVVGCINTDSINSGMIIVDSIISIAGIRARYDSAQMIFYDEGGSGLSDTDYVKYSSYGKFTYAYLPEMICSTAGMAGLPALKALSGTWPTALVTKITNQYEPIVMIENGSPDVGYVVLDGTATNPWYIASNYTPAIRLTLPRKVIVIRNQN